MKNLINIFWSKAKYNGQSIFENEEHYAKGSTLVSIFYFFVFIVAFQSITFNSQFPSWTDIVSSESLFKPQWSSAWISHFEWRSAIRFIYILLVGSSILSIVFWRQSRLVRIIVFIALFQFLSLVSSFGAVDHYLHMVVTTSIVFIFLPNQKSTSYKSDLLKAIFGIQTIMLATYSISGFYKLLGVAKQIKWGVTSALSPNGLTLQSAKTSYFSGNEYFFQQLLIDHQGYWIAIFHIAGYCIEFLSIIILFRFKLHRIWGLVLIIFHLGIALTVGPDFSIHLLPVALFIMFSPFGSKQYDLWNDTKSIFKK